MQVLILVEPKEGKGYRATAGSPFDISAEATTAVEATSRLEGMLRNRLHHGGRLALLDLNDGSCPAQPSLHLEPVPADDWFFKTFREAVEEARQRENEEERQRENQAAG
jgi:hypothetical protein